MKLLTKRFMQTGLGAVVALSMMPAAFAQEAAEEATKTSRTGMDSVTEEQIDDLTEYLLSL